MATGITIYNDAGTVQIDENYANLVLIDKISATISTGVGSDAVYDYSSSNEVVAVAVSVWPHTFSVLNVNYNGSTWNYRLRFYNNPETTETCNFTLYVFGRPPAPSENIGVKVYDSVGKLNFASEFKPLRIVGIFVEGNSFTGPGGRTLAAMYLSMHMLGVTVPVSPFPQVYETYTLRTSGNFIQPIMLTISSGIAGLLRSGVHAAVDVTHY